MSGMTTHVLDVSRGRPAAGVRVRLVRVSEGRGDGVEVRATHTTEQGRAVLIEAPARLDAGRWELVFDTGSYFAAQGQPTLYPEVRICIDVTDDAGHYHLPLLVSPFGYTTYRGS